MRRRMAGQMEKANKRAPFIVIEEVYDADASDLLSYM